MKLIGAFIISIVIAGIKADCPIVCPHTLVDPTCGSDGQLYYSECDLNRSNCATGKDVVKLPWSECKADCEHSYCTLHYIATCGSNGQVYGNECALLWASCGLPEPIKEEPMSRCKTD